MWPVPHDSFLMQEAAGTLFKNGRFDDAAARYRKCERHCLWAIEQPSFNKQHAVEVQQQLSLCRLNRSLCLYKKNLYKESQKLCMQVLDHLIPLLLITTNTTTTTTMSTLSSSSFPTPSPLSSPLSPPQVLDDRVSLESTRCKAGIRAGLCLINMYAAADRKERRTGMLETALECADSAEFMCDGDRDFVAAIARIRNEAREKLLEAGLSAAAPPATLSASLSNLPPPIPPLIASALLIIDPPPPSPP